MRFVYVRKPGYVNRLGKPIEWMTMTQEEFSARFKGLPIKRAKWRGLLRNVAVALAAGAGDPRGDAR